MKKTLGIQRQKIDWRTWRLSLAFNLLILGVMLMLFYPKYVNKADVVMQNLLAKLGFTRCGIIHVQEDDDPRFAYEK